MLWSRYGLHEWQVRSLFWRQSSMQWTLLSNRLHLRHLDWRVHETSGGMKPVVSTIFKGSVKSAVSNVTRQAMLSDIIIQSPITWQNLQSWVYKVKDFRTLHPRTYWINTYRTLAFKLKLPKDRGVGI